jgi:putative spermidine/putrescine transport system permease protein
MDRWSLALRACFLAAVLTLLLAPLVVVIGVSLNRSPFVFFPPRGLSLHWYFEVLGSSAWTGPLEVSAVAGCATAAAAGLLGTITGLALSRGSLVRRHLVEPILLAPIFIPGILTGMGLLFFLGRLQLVGGLGGLVAGHVVVTVPYVIRTVYGGVPSTLEELEAAAATLGAGPTRTFLRVSVPLALPAVASGMFFAFLLSFDNVTISLFLAGPRTVTLPVQIFNYVQFSNDPSVAAISTLLMLATMGALLAAERLTSVRSFVAQGRADGRP